MWPSDRIMKSNLLLLLLLFFIQNLLLCCYCCCFYWTWHCLAGKLHSALHRNKLNQPTNQTKKVWLEQYDHDARPNPTEMVQEGLKLQNDKPPCQARRREKRCSIKCKAGNVGICRVKVKHHHDFCPQTFVTETWNNKQRGRESVDSHYTSPSQH